MMLRGRIEVLTKDELYDVHMATLEVLERTGVVIENDEALKILDQSGAPVDYKKRLVRVPQYMVKEAVKKAPTRITLASRDGKHDMKLEGSKTYFGTLGCPPNMLDLENGKKRLMTKADLEGLARVADALEHVDYFHIMGAPQDVPAEVCDLHRWDATIRNTSKHIVGGTVYTKENLPYLIKMLCSVAGSEEDLRKQPFVTGVECPVAPLWHGDRQISLTIEFAKHKLPIAIYSEPQAGGTSPVTLAGTLVVTNAEVLSGLVATQFVSPGAPVLYCSVATIMDMRTGNIAFGSPETALLTAATTQMARYYQIPNIGPGGRTDSKIPDEQASYEKSIGALMSALAGVNLSGMAGLLDSNLLASSEQLVIDNEIIGRVKRVAKGFDVTDDTLATDIIDKVGPRGVFLAQRHTRDYLQKEHYMPILGDRRSYDGWTKDGAKDIREVARAKAKEILATHKPEQLENDVEKELVAIVSEAEKMYR